MGKTGDTLSENAVMAIGQELYLKHLRESMSKSTFRVYGAQMRAFTAWCAEHGLPAFPSDGAAVAAYVERMIAEKKSVSSIRQALAAISKAHAAMRFPDPVRTDYVRAASAAAARSMGRAPHRKRALRIDDIALMLDYITGDEAKDVRDRALLSVGFMGAFRRSELSELRVSDLSSATDRHGRTAIVVTLRHSKTDQTGERAQRKALFHTRRADAVAMLDEWLRFAVLSGDDPVFCRVRKGGHVVKEPITGENISLIIKKRAREAGLTGDIAGHSLRRGFITSALKEGATERSVMHQTGHRSVTVMRGYQELNDVTEDNAAEAF